LSLGDLDRGRLPAAIADVQSKPGYRAAAQTLKAAYAGRNGPARSAEAILRYLESRMRQAA
jgi:hypothetical protein